MAENQFQGHQEKSKCEKLLSANRAMGLCEDGGGIFFFSISILLFPLLRGISQQQQRACC